MSGGLVLSGEGNGAQSFQMPTVLVDGGITFTVPAPRGVYTFLAAGLLQWIRVGPAMFTSLAGPPGQPVPDVSVPRIARGCIPGGDPIRLGQTLAITDAANALIERWTVPQVAETPFGRMIPMWAGSAYIRGAAAIAPFTITATGFSVGDAWSFSIPGHL